MTEDGCTIKQTTNSKLSSESQKTQRKQPQESHAKGYFRDFQEVSGFEKISIGDQQQKRDKRNNFAPQRREWRSRNAMRAERRRNNRSKEHAE